MLKQDYMEFEADYAGSRSKNRFKFEVYWGLSKFLEIIKHNKNKGNSDYGCYKCSGSSSCKGCNK